ncbi:MAG: sugar phosphate isomerase/epimerase family protein [bacterium]
MHSLPSISAHLFAYEPLTFDHLQAVAGAGYRQVELWPMKPHFAYDDPAATSRLRGWLGELSLEPVSFHAPFYAHLGEARAGKWLSLADSNAERRLEAINQTQTALIAMADLGARIGVLHPSAPGEAGAADTADGFRQSIERLIPTAEHLGVTLAIENIPAPLGGAGEIEALVDRINHPCVRVCIDAGHALLTEGEGAGEAFGRLAPLAAAVHLHDNDGESDAHLIPGEGKAPFSDLWRALDAAGYEGPLTYELSRPGEMPYAEVLAELGRSAPLPASKPGGSA